MDKQNLDNKITDVAKTLLSYCTARTSNRFDAEDLAHDIILEIYKSADNLRNEEAFFGFMWSVANNVYKNWCKNKSKKKEIVLSDNIIFEDNYKELEESDLYLLRRELMLLNQKYRKAVILYYIENISCYEISKKLSISESMVKYLLFKSRQILKEGIIMQRNYGKQSYNPKELSLLFWGNGNDNYYHLCDSKISQNILFACYNDSLTAEQISLEIGVSLPYMEENLVELCENNLLKKDGNKFSTNMIIFTKDFTNEVSAKTVSFRESIADILVKSIDKNEEKVRSIGFIGSDMNKQTLSWQMTCFILYKAIFEKLQNKIEIAYPKDKYGIECFTWGVEKSDLDVWTSQFAFGVSNVVNENGDYIQFMDFPINGEMVHHYFFNRQNITNIFIDIAKGDTKHFSGNDKSIAADMIRNRFINSNENKLSVNVPVFTTEQYKILENIFSDTAEKISVQAESLMKTVADILKNHVPVHLKKFAHSMAYFRLFEDAISTPVSILYDKKFLLSYKLNELLPTTYIILKK